MNFLFNLLNQDIELRQFACKKCDLWWWRTLGVCNQFKSYLSFTEFFEKIILDPGTTK